ncbi:MAG: hypothetical protein HQM16_14910 [Deltaproteobacteria bacterium]|nr:hypothetical protein [Deltaproteobacteria bacterium]
MMRALPNRIPPALFCPPATGATRATADTRGSSQETQAQPVQGQDQLGPLTGRYRIDAGSCVQVASARFAPSAGAARVGQQARQVSAGTNVAMGCTGKDPWIDFLQKRLEGLNRLLVDYDRVDKILGDHRPRDRPRELTDEDISILCCQFNERLIEERQLVKLEMQYRARGIKAADLDRYCFFVDRIREKAARVFERHIPYIPTPEEQVILGNTELMKHVRVRDRMRARDEKWRTEPVLMR